MTPEQERRAIGARLEAERRGTDRSIADALTRIIRPETQSRPLRRIDPRGALTARRGTANYNGEGKQVGGGGVSWPLSETDKAKRTTADELVSTTDGLVVVVFKRVTGFEMQDGGGNIGKLEFKE
ncbi:hypothetical protein [Pseudomonas aeruginosa]|uniref:hypothetical protein n=1 Tax=Pseudomonas aeruginosa TaxID=287 RepID=UPI0009A1701E|nr:hypothetical protein [Pseudomonas aeruginosa]